MSSELTVPRILQIASICQYMASQAVSNANNYKGDYFDKNIARMIYIERVRVQRRYNANPADPTLIGTANYLYALLGKFALLAQARLASLQVAPPIVTGPGNQTVNVGQTATFTVGVTSAVPFTVQWYDNANNPIPGANTLAYQFPNAQLSDSGVKTFYVKATNSAGTVTSQVAVLTVNAQIQAFLWYGDVDPWPLLSAGTDNLAYQLVVALAHNANIAFNMPLAASNNKYQVMKQPVTEKIKTVWINTQNNQDILDPTGDQNWRASITIGGFRYYVTRQAISIDNQVLSESFNG